MNLQEALHKFEKKLKLEDCSKNTIKSYMRAVKQTMAEIDFNSFTQDDLEDIAVLLRKKYETGGNRLRYAALNSFCKLVLERDDLHLKIPKQENKNNDILTHEEVTNILNISKTKQISVYVVLKTIYNCALRKSEACNMDLDDVNFKNSQLTLRRTKSGTKVVFMNSKVEDSIKDYIDNHRNPKYKNEKALFLNTYGERIGEKFIRTNLKQCAVEAGITQRVYPHLLRASCITYLFDKGINPQTVKKHARHKKLYDTMIYNRPISEQMKHDIERIQVGKPTLNKEERMVSVIDKFIHGEITNIEMNRLLEFMRPKELKNDSEITGYVRADNLNRAA
jgi:integrase/recombinase XerD